MNLGLVAARHYRLRRVRLRARLRLRLHHYRNSVFQPGSSWTTSPASLNTARTYLSSAGIQTAAVAFGGSGGLTSTELWNGTSWTSTNPMATGRNLMGSAGTQTAGLGFGGYVPGPGAVGNTEEWSGPQTTATASTLTTS